MAYTDDDHGGNTAQFRAFAERQDEDPRTGGPGSRVWLISGLVLAAAVIVVIVASLA